MLNEHDTIALCCGPTVTLFGVSSGSRENFTPNASAPIRCICLLAEVATRATCTSVIAFGFENGSVCAWTSVFANGRLSTNEPLFHCGAAHSKPVTAIRGLNPPGAEEGEGCSRLHEGEGFIGFASSSLDESVKVWIIDVGGYYSKLTDTAYPALRARMTLQSEDKTSG